MVEQPPQQQQIDLKDLFADIGELQYEIRLLRRSLQTANERILEMSKGLQVEKEEKIKDE